MNVTNAQLSVAIARLEERVAVFESGIVAVQKKLDEMSANRNKWILETVKGVVTALIGAVVGAFLRGH